MTLIPMGSIPAHYADRLGRNRTAVVIGNQTRSWGELDENSTRRAWALKERGVGQDDFVTLAIANCCEFFEWTFAVWKLGATPHLVSSRIAIGELESMLGLVKPKVGVASEHDRTAHLGLLPVDLGLSGSRLDPLPKAVAKSWKAMSSGGSTGQPKVIVDHRPGEFDTESEYLRIEQGEVVLNPGPLYHNAPFCVSHNALFKGGLLIGMPKFDAEETLRLIDRWKASTVNFVPTMMLRIWRLPDEVKARYEVSSLRNVWHMAAPMPPWLKEAWIDWIGAEKIYEAYAGTEQLGATTINGVDWLTHRGSVGLPKNCDIRIVDENGDEVSAGTVGEILLRPHFTERMFHYLGAETSPLSGQFETLGDFGWVDEDGYLYLADRRTDLIISGGANIYPAEVESALTEHPGVQAAAVIGLPHEDLGAAVHAIVQAGPGWAERLTGADLADYLKTRLVRYKIPRSFEFVSDDIRDDAGKVRRSRLRADRLALPAI